MFNRPRKILFERRIWKVQTEAYRSKDHKHGRNLVITKMNT